MAQNKKQQMRTRRRYRIRKKISGTSDRPRLAVFRSLKHIQAQLIDDTTGKSLVGLATYSSDVRDRLASLEGKCAQSKEVGRTLAQKAKEAGISRVVFDRGGYLYHGRVKALADGAREGGLEL